MDSITNKKRKAEITILDATSTTKTSPSSPSPKSRRVTSTGDINDNDSTNDSNNNRPVEESEVSASSQPSNIASSSKSSKRTSREDRRQSTDEPEGISATAPTAAPQESPNNNVQESHSAPPSGVSHKPLVATDVPVSLPTQIAVVKVSSSKRAAFPPYKQKSLLSIPNAASAPKLKGILKSPSSTRGLNRDHELDSTKMRNPFVVTTGSDYSEREPFVKEALKSLQSEDAQIRSSAYLNLQAKFREGDENPFYLKEVEESLGWFARYLIRDLDLCSPPNLIQATLKCTGYFLFNQTIVALFTSKEIEALLVRILNLVNAADEKPTCNLAIWALYSTRIPQRLLFPFLPHMIEAFLDNLESRFKSPSITSGSLGGMFTVFTQFPNEIVVTVQSWLMPVLTTLISPIPGIRSRALELLKMTIPKLTEKEDPRRIQAVNEFMDDYSTEFLEVLTANFLDANDEVYAITVWGTLVTLMGKRLQESPLLNPMLKIVEKCFNSTSSVRTEINMAAFQAWTRLIYNFAIGGYIANEKPLKLMLTPFANCLFNERQKRIRLACFNTWISLIYALGSRLSKYADQVLFPQLKLAIVDESEHVRDLALRLIAALVSNSGGQEKLSRRNPEALIPGEWPNCDPEKLALLKHDTESTGYIIRADMIYYFFTCVIEIFSPRTLMFAQYQVRDKIHDNIYNAVYPVSEPTSQTSGVVSLPKNESLRSGVILSPFEFILKTWLATGESVIGTALEAPFWKAISASVEF
ncbi:Rap1-interacting factor 1 N terminal-domain-containing protein [Lobosporangium transversale]|uniref:Rap1-interacting factor 1 N terminal-domain-containing protein n=1 Tax=Lobosporangium transversale TaxID=64571 RepID=A0A1Y2GFP0_9FUNG|nr:Rap1-interacting factor 1 N terminal-domain-containing protein [Lobosporangium transversale]ORZ08236.1 Rap1-interacting factor 1 N terminal-domain-containing protein [Lobosporangium transversale]|eukprot:XP_021878319.1 Rap1-interacting factor 1 N terminal-domain-containing protein [Lobosporangium transversale]